MIGSGSRVWFDRHDLDLGVVGWFSLGGLLEFRAIREKSLKP